MRFTKEIEMGGTAWHFCLASLLVGFVILVGLPFPVQSSSGQGTPPAGSEAVLAYNPHNLLRLHILANSDDPADQQLKLRVRDRLLEMTGELFGPIRTATEAEWLVRLHKGELEAVALQEIRSAGKSYGVRLEIGDVYFPDRRYGALIYPAGIYRAVQLVLGEGRGANWWCVLFPPLCLDLDNSAPDSQSGPGVVRAASTTAGSGTAAAPPAVTKQFIVQVSSDKSQAGSTKPESGKPVQVKVGWKWLPDDWWDRVRGWFR